jgi:hypothetical protein
MSLAVSHRPVTSNAVAANPAQPMGKFVVDKVTLGQELLCYFDFLLISFYLCSELIFIYVLILPEEQTDEDWKTFQKTKLFWKSRELDIKFSHFHLAFEWLNV